jgi:microsomal epoxide hydrolase
MNIQPFRIAIESGEILDLQRRLRHTRWPMPIAGAHWRLGMDSAVLKDLTEYWLHRFDWRAVEAMLNRVAHCQAISESGSIHFVHLRGTGSSVLPIVLTHGWPSTFAELLRLGAMLSDPTSYGASAADAFDVVIPSLPGFVFSTPPAMLGTNVFTIGEQWSALMTALGYGRFIAHGGDIGAAVSTALGLRHAERLFGLHLHYIPGSYQPHIAAPCELSAEETAYLQRRATWDELEGGYSHVQATKPDVLGPALNDSPVGLAAWILDKFRSWSDCDGDPERRFSREELLTTISLYWFTRSMPSAVRLYWESRQRPLKLAAGERVEVPVAVARFPKEIPIPPRSYVERGYNVTRWTEMPKGGHFAALEEPDALAADIRSFARQFRQPVA